VQVEIKSTSPTNEGAKVFLGSPKRMLLNNEWVDAAKGGCIDSADPATGQVLTSIPKGSVVDVDAAVLSARVAFESGVWRDMLPAERAKILWKIGELIDTNIEELAELETLDQGKPLGVARWAEIPGAAEQFRYFAGLCTKLESAVIPSSIGYQPPGKRIHSYTLKEPVGVVAAITPWNSPLILNAMKLAPALCVGCSVVLKPAEDTSLTAIRLGELCVEAGLPAGVLNIVTGYGHEVGQALAEHKGVDKVTFTGSTETGRKILVAAKGNLKRVTLELGGKSPMIVMDDADLELAIPGVANAIFFNSGQVCVAGTRLYVHNTIADQFFDGLADIANGMSLGHGLDQDTQMGPLINVAQAEKVETYIKSGVAAGAKLIAGGGRGGPAGTFIEPTILTDCNNSMSIELYKF
jgi:phenylacetaldehyde dehydrogenase